MLRKILMILLIIAMMPAALGESLEIESEPPEEPIETDGEYIHVSCAYDADAGQSVYTAVLTEDAPVTAQDLLYSRYVYLHPAGPGDTQL